jgi:hypothetical protein
MDDTITKPKPEQAPKKSYHKSILKQNLPIKRASQSRLQIKKRSKIVATELINGASAKQACLTAGYSNTTNVNQVLMNKEVVKSFNSILEKTGLTDDAIADKLKQLFNAKTTKFFADKGVVTDQREVEDNTIQLDTTKTLLKVKGHITDKTSIEVPGIEDILEQIANRRK